MLDFSNREVGSASRLEGKVYVLLFYVGTPSHPVTARTHEEWSAEVVEAQRWLQRQAAHYGKHVEFENAAYGLDGSLIMDDIPSGPYAPNAYYFPDKVYRLLKLKDSWEMYRFVRTFAAHYDQYLSLILCNMKGRSFSCPVSKELYTFNRKAFFFESSVIYRYEDVDPLQKTTSASIAHETLHLFGATDLYAHDDSSKERQIEQTYRRLYPNSIMLGAPFGIQQTEVDELNAWLVGWRNKPL